MAASSDQASKSFWFGGHNIPSIGTGNNKQRGGLFLSETSGYSRFGFYFIFVDSFIDPLPL